MYLLDTNIWLELLLNQEKAKEVEQFLDFIKDSEFSFLHSHYIQLVFICAELINLIR